MKKCSLFAVSFAAVILMSCSSAPPPPVTPTSPPAWIEKAPEQEGDSLIFTASGTDGVGDRAVAEKKADADLRDKITNALGPKITGTANASVKGALESFRNEVEATLTSKGSLSGLRIAERYIAQNGGAVTVYLKAAYSKGELERKKSQILDLLNNLDASVSVFEREGDRRASAGDYFEAVNQYILAASVAQTPDLVDFSAKLDRNLSKALTILSKINLLATGTATYSTRTGQPFEQSFDVRAVYGSTSNDPPVPGVSLRFNYKVKKNGKVILTGQSLKTDSQGYAHFSYPTPDFAAKDNVIVVLDVNPFLERLTSVPRELRSKLASLEEIVGKNRLLIPFSVESSARDLSLAVVSLDIDDKGVSIKKTESTTGIQEQLAKAGFKVSLLPGLDPNVLKKDFGLSVALKNAAKNTPRAVLGTFTLLSVTNESGVMSAEVSGTVKVLDLATGSILFSETKRKSSTGNDRAAAIANAFRQAGSSFGSLIADSLP